MNPNATKSFSFLFDKEMKSKVHPEAEGQSKPIDDLKEKPNHSEQSDSADDILGMALSVALSSLSPAEKTVEKGMEIAHEVDVNDGLPQASEVDSLPVDDLSNPVTRNSPVDDLSSPVTRNSERKKGFSSSKSLKNKGKCAKKKGNSAEKKRKSSRKKKINSQECLTGDKVIASEIPEATGDAENVTNHHSVQSDISVMNKNSRSPQFKAVLSLTDVSSALNIPPRNAVSACKSPAHAPPKRGSQSTPRRKTSHVRVLDFGTPRKRSSPNKMLKVLKGLKFSPTDKKSRKISPHKKICSVSTRKLKSIVELDESFQNKSIGSIPDNECPKEILEQSSMTSQQNVNEQSNLQSEKDSEFGVQHSEDEENLVLRIEDEDTCSLGPADPCENHSFVEAPTFSQKIIDSELQQSSSVKHNLSTKFQEPDGKGLTQNSKESEALVSSGIFDSQGVLGFGDLSTPAKGKSLPVRSKDCNQATLVLEAPSPFLSSTCKSAPENNNVDTPLLPNFPGSSLKTPLIKDYSLGPCSSSSAGTSYYQPSERSATDSEEFSPVRLSTVYEKSFLDEFSNHPEFFEDHLKPDKENEFHTLSEALKKANKSSPNTPKKLDECSKNLSDKVMGEVLEKEIENYVSGVDIGGSKSTKNSSSSGGNLSSVNAEEKLPVIHDEFPERVPSARKRNMLKNCKTVEDQDSSSSETGVTCSVKKLSNSSKEEGLSRTKQFSCTSSVENSNSGQSLENRTTNLDSEFGNTECSLMKILEKRCKLGKDFISKSDKFDISNRKITPTTSGGSIDIDNDSVAKMDSVTSESIGSFENCKFGNVTAILQDKDAYSGDEATPDNRKESKLVPVQKTSKKSNLKGKYPQGPQANLKSSVEKEKEMSEIKSKYLSVFGSDISSSDEFEPEKLPSGKKYTQQTSDKITKSSESPLSEVGLRRSKRASKGQRKKRFSEMKESERLLSCANKAEKINKSNISLDSGKRSVSKNNKNDLSQSGVTFPLVGLDEIEIEEVVIEAKIKSQYSGNVKNSLSGDSEGPRADLGTSKSDRSEMGRLHSNEVLADSLETLETLATVGKNLNSQSVASDKNDDVSIRETVCSPSIGIGAGGKKVGAKRNPGKKPTSQVTEKNSPKKKDDTKSNVRTENISPKKKDGTKGEVRTENISPKKKDNTKSEVRTENISPKKKDDIKSKVRMENTSPKKNDDTKSKVRTENIPPKKKDGTKSKSSLSKEAKNVSSSDATEPASDSSMNEFESTGLNEAAEREIVIQADSSKDVSGEAISTHLLEKKVERKESVKVHAKRKVNRTISSKKEEEPCQNANKAKKKVDRITSEEEEDEPCWKTNKAKRAVGRIISSEEEEEPCQNTDKAKRKVDRIIYSEEEEEPCQKKAKRKVDRTISFGEEEPCQKTSKAKKKVGRTVSSGEEEEPSQKSNSTQANQDICGTYKIEGKPDDVKKKAKGNSKNNRSQITKNKTIGENSKKKTQVKKTNTSNADKVGSHSNNGKRETNLVSGKKDNSNADVDISKPQRNGKNKDNGKGKQIKKANQNQVGRAKATITKKSDVVQENCGDVRKCLGENRFVTVTEYLKKTFEKEDSDVTEDEDLDNILSAEKRSPFSLWGKSGADTVQRFENSFTQRKTKHKMSPEDLRANWSKSLEVNGSSDVNVTDTDCDSPGQPHGMLSPETWVMSSCSTKKQKHLLSVGCARVTPYIHSPNKHSVTPKWLQENIEGEVHNVTPRSRKRKRAYSDASSTLSKFLHLFDSQNAFCYKNTTHSDYLYSSYL